MKTLKKIFDLNKLSSFLLYLSILIFIISFNFAHNPPGGWYQQFLPNINGASIRDINFTDSLNGYAVTSIGGSDSYILKTTNGGDNWIIKFNHSQPFVRVEFINATTGFTNAYTTIFKTTNAGENWSAINLPAIFGDDMFVLNEDTIWLAMSESLTGGVFRTTNGGASWQQQLYLGSQNPSHIYMYNSRIGFTATGAGLYKTTNSGVNWILVGGGFFRDIFFADSLTGWKNNGPATIFQKTIDGGLNWVTYNLPPEQGNILISRIVKFYNIVKDTIWGVGATGTTGSGNRGLIYKSTNGGQTWGYQLPDSININIFSYQHVKFTTPLIGWSYSGNRGVHTTTGGNDTTYYVTSVNQIVSTIPSDYKLYQNYPNPFNPLTKMKYELKVESFVKLRVFNIEGKEVKTIVNEKQNEGVYEADFSVTEYGSSLSSGVYFYSLLADDKIVDTKKMIVVK